MRHRIFGGLRRMNAVQGDRGVHFFMEGFEGAEIAPGAGPAEGVGELGLAPMEQEELLWRQQLRGACESLRSHA